MPATEKEELLGTSCQPFYNPKNWQNIQEPIQQAFDNVFNRLHLLEAKIEDLTTENNVLKKQLKDVQTNYATTKYVNNYIVEAARREINTAFKQQHAAFEEDAEIVDFLNPPPIATTNEKQSIMSRSNSRSLGSSSSEVETNGTRKHRQQTVNALPYAENTNWIFMQTAVEKINRELSVVREDLAQKASKRSVVAAIRQKAAEIVTKQDEFYETVSEVLREKADVVTVNNALAKKADAIKIADVMSAFERRIQQDIDSRVARITKQSTSGLLGKLAAVQQGLYNKTSSSPLNNGINNSNINDGDDIETNIGLEAVVDNNIADALFKSDLIQLRNDIDNNNFTVNQRIDGIRNDLTGLKNAFVDMFGSDSSVYLATSPLTNSIGAKYRAAVGDATIGKNNGNDVNKYNDDLMSLDETNFKTIGLDAAANNTYSGSFVKTLTTEILTKARRNASEQLDTLKVYMKQELSSLNNKVDNCEIDIRAGDNRVESLLRAVLDKNITNLTDKTARQNEELTTISKANSTTLMELSATVHLLKKLFGDTSISGNSQLKGDGSLTNYICDENFNVQSVATPVARITNELAAVNKKVLTLVEAVQRKADKAEMEILREKISMGLPSAKCLASLAQKPSVEQVKEMINQSIIEIKRWIDECACAE